MAYFDEIAAGLALLGGAAQEQGCRLSHRSLGNHSSYYIEVINDDRRVDFTLSEEYLADLPGTKSHQQDVKSAFYQIAQRLHNPFPNEFYSSSGTPFSVEFQWPLKTHPSRDVLWLHATLTDLRFPELIAKAAPLFSLSVLDFDLKFKPFKRLSVLINCIRRALDNSKLDFFKKGAQPTLLQEIPIFDLPTFSRFSDHAVQQFLAGKIYWLAFQRANKAGTVWIADPWDAEYLGISVTELIRAAQVLEARGLIQISQSGDFASATDMMIANAHAEPIRQTRPIGFNP